MWHRQHNPAYGLPFVAGDSEGFDKRAERLKGMIGRELKRAGKGIPKPEGDLGSDLAGRAETLFDHRANHIREMIAKEKKRLVSSHEEGGKDMGFQEVEAVRRDSAQSVDLQAIAAWLPQCTPTKGEAEAGHGHAEPASRPSTQGHSFDLAKYKEDEIDPDIVLKAREELERIGIINKQAARGIPDAPELPPKQLPLSLSGCTPCPSCAKHLFLASLGFCPGCGLQQQQQQQRGPGEFARGASRPAAATGWASAGPHTVSISTPSGMVKVSFEGETGPPSSSSPAVPRPMARAPSPGSQRPSGGAPPSGGGGGSRGPSPGPPGSGRGPSPGPPGSAGRPVRRTPSGAAPITGQARTPAGAVAAPVVRVSATPGDAATPQVRQGRPPAPSSAAKEEGAAPAAVETGTVPAPAAAVAAGEELVVNDAGSGGAAVGNGEAVLADSLHSGGVVAAVQEGDAAVASDSAGGPRAGLFVPGGDADEAVQEGV